MNPSTALATVLVDELIGNGVREAVLAPGSRSAPLAFALHDADAAGRIRLHVRIDERSAGFLALGLAKVSQRPVPVVTTSGTAAANLHPAVLEASESGLPLIVLTADRPPELRGIGANQTVDQLKLYGGAVRLFHEVGAPESRIGQNAYWRSLVCRAVAASSGTSSRDPGPVHLNLALRDPLVPDVPPDWPESLAGRGDGPWTVVAAAASAEPAAVDHWPLRTLVIVGDSPLGWGQEAVRLAEASGWPVLSEPSGNARRGPNALTWGHALLDQTGEGGPLRPERVLVVGRPTLTRNVQALLRDPGVEVHVAAPGPRWADPGLARSVSFAVPRRAEHRPVDASWVESWREAESSFLATVLQPSWSGASIAAALHDALPAGSLLVAGSSSSVRELMTASPHEEVTVIANRGASGIDGTVSTAMGAALAWQAAGGGPAFALMGDLTFIHDSNGLVVGPQEPLPRLTIVVVNNDGGGIFAGLEPGRPEHAGAFERVFGTPTGADLAALCATSGTAYTRVATLEDLVSVATDPRADLQVVEARVPR